jgi:hypothetical protein
MLKKCVIAVVAAMVFASLAAYSQAQTSLYPTLINLPGWNADDPEGVTMDLPGMKMISATRNYSQGEKELNAMIFVGSSQMASAASSQGAMNFQSTEASVVVKSINGFQVQIYYDKQEKSGGIIVVLDEGKNALFTLGYEGITDNDALALAQKFNWSDMKQKAGAL